MAQRHAAQLLISSLAVLLAGYARADGCCYKDTKLPYGGTASSCFNTISTTSCGNAGGYGYLAGQYCAGTQCTVPLPPPPPPPPPKAAMRSDPVLTGFDNVTFEFFGSAGSNYSVISSTEFSANVRLVEAGPLHIREQEGEGTFVSSLAVLLPSLELIVHASEAGNMTFSLNGIEMDIASPAIEKAMSYSPYAPDLGQVITVTQEPFRFTIIAVKQYNDDISGYNRGHLDFLVDLTGPVVSPITGALGQTMYGSIKADESSFAIPSLTYHKTFSETSISTSRRLQALEGHLHFPLHARLAATYGIGP